MHIALTDGVVHTTRENKKNQLYFSAIAIYNFTSSYLLGSNIFFYKYSPTGSVANFNTTHFDSIKTQTRT